MDRLSAARALASLQNSETADEEPTSDEAAHDELAHDEAAHNEPAAVSTEPTHDDLKPPTAEKNNT